MEKVLENYMNQIRFGKRQAYRNMAVFPVIMDDALSPDYLILDEALQDRASRSLRLRKAAVCPN